MASFEWEKGERAGDDGRGSDCQNKRSNLPAAEKNEEREEAEDIIY